MSIPPIGTPVPRSPLPLGPLYPRGLGTVRYRAFFSNTGTPAGNCFGVQSQIGHLLTITQFGKCSPRRLNLSFNSCTEYINVHPEQRKHFLKNRRLHRGIHICMRWSALSNSSCTDNGVHSTCGGPWRFSRLLPRCACARINRCLRFVAWWTTF